MLRPAISWLERLLDVGLHDLDRADQLGVMHAQPHPQRHALAVVRAADAVDDALLGDLGRQLVAVRQRDPVQHQVERRGAARAGEAVAVDLVQVRGDRDLGERLEEARQVLPVDGAAMAVEQAGARQHVRAGAEGADLRRRGGPSGAARRTPPCSGSAPSRARRTARRPAARRCRSARAPRWRRRPGSRCRCWRRPARRRARPAASRRGARPDRRLAMRSGSMALVNAIIEKSGISRNRTVSVAALGGGGWTVAHGLVRAARAVSTCRDRDVVTVAQRRRQSQQRSVSPGRRDRFRICRVAWAQAVAAGRQDTPVEAASTACCARAKRLACSATRSSRSPATRSPATATGRRPGAAPSPSRPTTWSSSAPAGTASPPPTISPRSTASPTSPCSSAAGSAAATPAATPRSAAPTTSTTRAPPSTTTRSSSGRA